MEKYWDYNNTKISNIEDIPDWAIGFVYLITHKPTGKKYIGKKNLYFERNVKIGKKELAKIKEERKEKGLRGKAPAKKKVVKESDWLDYYGSQKDLKELVVKSDSQEFEREILEFAGSKKTLTYYEIKYIINYNALERSDYYNDNILGKFFMKDFKM